jgi:hypothetical protein
VPSLLTIFGIVALALSLFCVYYGQSRVDVQECNFQNLRSSVYVQYQKNRTQVLDKRLALVDEDLLSPDIRTKADDLVAQIRKLDFDWLSWYAKHPSASTCDQSAPPKS